MKKLLICFSFILIFCAGIGASPFETSLLSYVNEFRADNALAPLVLDEKLTRMAFNVSARMEKRTEFGHSVITNEEWDAMAEAYGLDRHCDELLVYSTDIIPDIVKSFECLRDSPAHREGLLMPDGVVFGAAYISGFYCAYVTVYIGGPDRKGESYD